MKHFLLFLFLAVGITAHSQDFTKDTIQLKEVTLKKKKPRIRSYRFWSICTSYEGLYMSEMITLVDRLPAGYLESLKFDFNNHYSRKNKREFGDTHLELLFYEVNPDGTPGKKIEHERKIVTVDKNHKGKMEIDISGLSIVSNGKIFVGLKRLMKHEKEISRIEVDCTCGEYDDYISYHRYNEANKWFRSHSSAFAMVVKVDAF